MFRRGVGSNATRPRLAVKGVEMDVSSYMYSGGFKKGVSDDPEGAELAHEL